MLIGFAHRRDIRGIERDVIGVDFTSDEPLEQRVRFAKALRVFANDTDGDLGILVQRVVARAEVSWRTDRHQQIISIMPERKVAHDWDRKRLEEFAQESIDFALTPTLFQLANNNASDFFESTRQPQVGQHTVEAIRRFADFLPKPNAVVDPIVIRSSNQRSGKREAAAEQNAVRFAM